MLYKFKNNELEHIEFLGYSDLQGKEKDLEDLLAKHLKKLFIEDDQLMPIFQERPRQEEPDICALDKSGNLIIFELKRGAVENNTTIQILRYSQLFGQKTYSELNKMYNTYCGCDCDLAKDHAETFELDHPLHYDKFNKMQKLILVGNSSDIDLMKSVEYWKVQGLNIDFIPYRFYEIGDELYFEFFSKPFDFHINPKDTKGIIFDTNRSYDENSIWDMFTNKKVSAYGNAARYVDSFRKNDYVLFYHKGYGIVAIGRITSSKSKFIESNEEKYQQVQFLTPLPASGHDLKWLTPSEIEKILAQSFYYASTIKSPYLTKSQSEKLLVELTVKYEE